MVDKRQTIVLASSSPRRQAFLHELGLAFEVQIADIDETPEPNEDPVVLAQRLAVRKAGAVAMRFDTSEPALIVAGDTVVALGNLLLGKPKHDEEAVKMLRLLRNRVHQVHSAICVLAASGADAATPIVRINTTNVWMRDYSDAEIDAYVATGDPLDKAGGYAIQHPTFAPVARLDGCLSSVIGLPLADLRQLLMAHGLDIPQVAPICMRQTNFVCCQSLAG